MYIFTILCYYYTAWLVQFQLEFRGREVIILQGPFFFLS